MSEAGFAKLGKYEVRGTLGKGAMGTVQDGWDPAIDRRVAIKTVRLPSADDPEAHEALARFKREAQAAGRLTHPNIVGVFDYGETDQVAFIVMEYVSGRSLKEILDAGERMPLATTLRLVGDVLAGLAYSHERGVVHRDIKPANIMVTPDSHAKIADFGIARIESSSMTQAGTVLGTPAYMSPEQFMGQVVDCRTDIYSAGVLLYQLLTGERPFDGGLTAIMHRALNTVPPRPSELSVTVPGRLDAVVLKAMARRPEDRFADARVFARALTDAAAAPVAAPVPDDATVVARPAARSLAQPPSPVATAPAPKNSRGPLLAGGGAALLVVMGLATYFLLPSKQETAKPIVTAEQTNKPVVTTTEPPERRPEGGPASPASETKPKQPDPEPKPNPGQVAIDVPPASTQVPQEDHTPVVADPSAVVPKPPLQTGNSGIAAPQPDLKPEAQRTDTASVDPADPADVFGHAPESVKQWQLALTAPHGLPPDHVPATASPLRRALDVLRPVAGGSSALGLGLANKRDPVLSYGENMMIAFTSPEFAGHLRLDYIQNDGEVTHLAPSRYYPDRTYLPSTHVELGRVRPDFGGWKVGPPAGSDLIVAIFSTAPLQMGERAATEPLETYLRDVQVAIDDLRRRGGNLALDTVTVELRP